MSILSRPTFGSMLHEVLGATGLGRDPVLRNKLVLDVELEVETPLAIQSGIEEFRRYIIRLKTYDGQDIIVIPESEIKGWLRSQAETIMYSMLEQVKSAIVDTCTKNLKLGGHAADIMANVVLITHTETGHRLSSCGPLLQVLIEESEPGTAFNALLSHVMKRLANQRAELEERLRSILTAIIEALCPVCRLFGGAKLAGRIHASTFTLGEETAVEALTSVAIDRYSGCASTHKLFEVEYIAPGAKFRGTIIIDNYVDDNTDEASSIDRVEARIVKELLRKSEQHCKLGSRRSVGFGTLKLIIKSEKVSLPQ